LIVGGFLLIQAFVVSKHYDPLYISKLNTGAQIILIGFVLARLGLDAAPGLLDLVLSLVVAATTIVSGLSYLVRWTRILARWEQAL
jgi:cardiolipin synthase (CMP-forming)